MSHWYSVDINCWLHLFKQGLRLIAHEIYVSKTGTSATPAKTEKVNSYLQLWSPLSVLLVISCRVFEMKK